MFFFQTQTKEAGQNMHEGNQKNIYCWQQKSTEADEHRTRNLMISSLMLSR